MLTHTRYQALLFVKIRALVSRPCRLVLHVHAKPAITPQVARVFFVLLAV
jgi:hypothetical protein